MNRLASLVRTLRHLVLRDRASRELEEEMRGHVAMRADALRTQGASASDATAEARRRFGNLTRWEEASRDNWGMGGWERLGQDLSYGARRLRKRPAFTGAVVLVLALGIGATTAMFSAVDAAMLRPLPFRDAGRLVVVPRIRLPFDAGDGAEPVSNAVFDFDSVVAMHRLFTDAAAYAVGALNLPDPDHPVRISAGVVTERFFATLGATAAQGRTFSSAESSPHGARVVVLSDAFWRAQFGGRPIGGLTIALNQDRYEVIGVMPRGFAFPSAVDLWIPMTNPTTPETFRAFRGFLPSTVIARLAPGVRDDDAARQVLARWNAVAAQAAVPGQQNEYDRVVADVRATGAVIPLQRSLAGDTRRPLLILLGATGLLLLIACANITNLLLSQAAARGREIALRTVLGATRRRVLRQLLTESVMLALLGVAAGLLLAPLTLRAMQAALPPALLGVAPPRLDLRVLGFAALTGLVTGIAFGLWPAFTITRSTPAETIKGSGGHGATSATGGRARRVLVVTECALTVLLLIGAGLMLRSFSRVMHTQRGLDAAQVGTLEMAIWAPNQAVRLTRLDRILAELERNPAIIAAGAINDLPLSGSSGIGLLVSIEGRPRPQTPEEMTFARLRIVTGGYFRAMGVPLLQGRVFSALDDSLAPRTAVIGQAMARKYWPGVDPLGRTFRVPGDSLPVTVIGVVGDVRADGLDQDPDMEMYLPAASRSMANLAIVARSTLPPAVLLRTLTDAVRAADPAQAVYHVRTMTDVVGISVASRRTSTLLIATFASLALLLAAVGVYAVVAYGVAQRRREFGIRAALGAASSDLLGLVAREMLWTGLTGAAIGLAGAWALAKVLEAMLFDVALHDPVTFLAVPAALLATVAVATLLPARRILAVNPAEVMREG